MREASVTRKTRETDIFVNLNLDGNGNAKINTGIGFLDHMLDLMTFHGKMDLEVDAKGDLDVDDHHTVEDIGIALGQAFKDALHDKKGIMRYGSVTLPMDESLASVNIDISGRPYLVFNCPFTRESIGMLSCEMIREFYYAFAMNAGVTLHVNLLYGDNDHHKAEAVFKAFGRAVKEAVCVVSDELPSTKGFLQ